MLSIFHLSDIHLKENENSIVDNVENFANIIECETGKGDAVIFLVSGDLAFSGKEEQYKIAKELFFKIENKIVNKAKKINFIFAQGNHDCDFSIQKESVRNALIDSIDVNKEEIIDNAIIEELVKVQWRYIEFSNYYHKIFNVIYNDPLLSVYEYKDENIKLIFKCFNTAWISSQKEKPGVLFFPFERYEGMEFGENDNFCISMFHHPLGWLNPNNARGFKNYLERTSSIVVTGHDHVSSSSIKYEFSGTSTELVEGAVLQDSNKKHNSAFNLLKFNFQNKTHCIKKIFLGSGGRYESTTIKEWFSFSGLKGIDRVNVEITEKFKNFLWSSEINLIHSKKRDVTIEDIFISPNISEIQWRAEKSKFKKIVDSKFLFEINNSGNKYLIIGEEKSGKTTLLKKVFFSFFNKSYCPVYIEGGLIRSTSSSEIEKLINKKIKEQYGGLDYNTIVGNESWRKYILIDDFHTSKLNADGKSIFIEYINNSFDNIIITANSMVIVEEISSNKQLYRGLINYKHYSIEDFGRLLRAKLVDKWNRIGQEHSIDEKELVQLNDKMLRVLNGIIGNNIVPSTPLFLLTIIQSIEAGTSFSPKNSTFGYYYEFLITRAFGLSGKKPDELDLFYNYSTELSWVFFSEKTRELSRENFEKFHNYFCAEFQKIELTEMIKSLLNAKIIDHVDGNYRFLHKYVYYFFVAKYISNKLSDESVQEETRELVDKICERVHIEEFYNIVMFLTHHSRDPFVIGKIVEKSKNIFSNIDVIRFDSDILKINQLMNNIPSLVMLETDYKENRERDLKIKDSFNGDGSDKYYSQDYDVNADIGNLNYVTKLNLAFKTVEVLGQIVRNHFGSLKKPVKLEIAEEAYKVGLRSLNKIFSQLQADSDRSVDAIKGYLEEKKIVDKKDIDKTARRYIFNICEIISFGFMKKISSSVGSERLFETFEQVLGRNDFPSYKLIDLFIKLEFENNIPFDRIKTLYQEFTDNFMAQSILKIIVLNYVYMFPTNYSERQKICSILDIAANEQKHLDYLSTRCNS